MRVVAGFHPQQQGAAAVFRALSSAATISAGLETGLPSASRMTSPGRRPFCAATPVRIEIGDRRAVLAGAGDLRRGRQLDAEIGQRGLAPPRPSASPWPPCPSVDAEFHLGDFFRRRYGYRSA